MLQLICSCIKVERDIFLFAASSHKRKTIFSTFSQLRTAQSSIESGIFLPTLQKNKYDTMEKSVCSTYSLLIRNEVA